MKPLLIACLSIFLVGTASASMNCENSVIGQMMGSQGTNIFLALMLTVILIAIAYGLGTAISNEHMIVFSKDEAHHLVFSIILVLSIGGIMATSCEFASFFYTTAFHDIGIPGSCSNMAGNTMNAISDCYVQKMEAKSKDLAERYIKEYISNQMDSTFSLSISIPLHDAYTVVPGAYKRVVANQYDMVLNSFVLPALMSISMQKLVLRFINQDLLAWVLPIAILLRIFVPTRQAGNVLIAVVLGLYFVVPFMYVFTLSMYDAVSTDCMTFGKSACDNAVDSFGCGDWVRDASGWDVTTGYSVTCGNPNSFWIVGSLLPQAFFLPNLTIAVLITFFGCAAKALRVIG